MDDSKRYMLLKLSEKNAKNNFPLFTCDNCRKDVQKVTKLSFSESEKSKSYHGHDDWEPYWINGNFLAISTCQNCSDKTYIVGTYNIDDREYVDENNNHRLDFEERFSIKYMSPAIELLKVPKKCPEIVNNYINSAAEVVFASPDLAANRLRTSVEALLTQEKIPRYEKNKKNIRNKLNTHSRIVLFTKKNIEVGALLEAVKWIGNDGSHDTSLTFSDIIDGLEIYSLALSLLYDDSSDAIRKKATLINKNKGVKKNPKPF